MEDRKQRLIDLGQEEMRREEAERIENERVRVAIRQFVERVARPALLEVGDSAGLIGRRARLEDSGQSGAKLDLSRNGSLDVTLEIEAPNERTASLHLYSGPARRRATPESLNLLADGETVADLTVDRVRTAILDQLERRLKGQI